MKIVSLFNDRDSAAKQGIDTSRQFAIVSLPDARKTDVHVKTAQLPYIIGDSVRFWKELGEGISDIIVKVVVLGSEQEAFVRWSQLVYAGCEKQAIICPHCNESFLIPMK